MDDPNRLRYQTMENSSRNTLKRYWRGAPFAEYDSLRAVRANVLLKIDRMFGKAATVGPVMPGTPGPSASAATGPSSGDVGEPPSFHELSPVIYPLPPPLQLAAMSKASAPRLDASQLSLIGAQIAAIKRVCLMRFPLEPLDDDLRELVESVWTTDDGHGHVHHHVAFHAPLSGMLNPDALRGISALRDAVVSLQEAWKRAVEGRRETLKGARRPDTPSSSTRAQHLRGLATITGLREASLAVELALWDFERNVSSAMYVGCDVAHLTKVVVDAACALGAGVKRYWPCQRVASEFNPRVFAARSALSSSIYTYAE